MNYSPNFLVLIKFKGYDKFFRISFEVTSTPNTSFGVSIFMLDPDKDIATGESDGNMNVFFRATLIFE